MKKQTSDYKRLLFRYLELVTKKQKGGLAPDEESEVTTTLSTLGLTPEAALEEASLLLLS